MEGLFTLMLLQWITTVSYDNVVNELPSMMQMFSQWIALVSDIYVVSRFLSMMLMLGMDCCQ